MILCVDVGNSNIVIGGMEGDCLSFVARIRTDPTKTSDEYCIDIKSILDVNGIKPKKLEGSIIASVVPRGNSPGRTVLWLAPA